MHDTGPVRRPRRRWLRRALVALALVAGATAVLLALAWVALPDVGDARDRVDALLAARHGRPAHLGPGAPVSRSAVAVEDQRFWSHHGVDPHSLARVLVAAVDGRGGDPGGSTIPQQLAKLLYTGDRHDPLGKLEQVGLAVKLSARWPRADILAMYLDAAYYGHGYWGVASASHGYFHAAPQRLGWAEASLLAGLVQAPSAYEPTSHFSAARRRQRHVLDRLVATGALTGPRADAAYDTLGRRARRLGFRTVAAG